MVFLNKDEKGNEKMKVQQPIRFVSAASLFDGHDAAIHVIRRILQSEGAEVIHLGHDRSVQSVVKAAIEEDVQGIAVSSYQGGHMEYFSYMLKMLKAQNCSHIKVFAGGGGVIRPSEIKELEALGVAKIFSPEDGKLLGLVGMIEQMLKATNHFASGPLEKINLAKYSSPELAQLISTLELGDNEKFASFNKASLALQKQLATAKKRCPVIGFSGTGGAGKSSLIDELLGRLLEAFPYKKFAVLSVDPTKQKSGGALLGDRIRYNCADNERVFVRSMATRQANVSINPIAKEVVKALACLDFDLVILESSGVGQSDSSIKDFCDEAIYVMTPEYGAPSQLEKIAMLDFAKAVVINKFDKPGAKDALRDVAKAYQRNQQLFDKAPELMPIFGTSAHVFGDLGTNKFFNHFCQILHEISPNQGFNDIQALPKGEAGSTLNIPKKRQNYLAEIADCLRSYDENIEQQAKNFEQIEVLEKLPELKPEAQIAELKKNVDQNLQIEMENYQKRQEQYEAGEFSYSVRQKNIKVQNYFTSLAGLKLPKVVAPKFNSQAETARFVGLENLPGYFPFTAGVFPFKRTEEDPTRMFAGEGGPECTNERFHFLSQGHEATRLSTAFDSVTLYGQDPSLRPDIYGKIGNAGVSICCLSDMKRLYSGFDLTDPKTSISMTINGPAPTMLAYLFNTAIDFEAEKYLRAQSLWEKTQEKIKQIFKEMALKKPEYRAALPKGHNGLGLGFLGLPSSLVLEKNIYENLKTEVLQKIRGTVQADILKEEQAQNTAIFSIDFSLKMMGDVQEYFIAKNINNFYSVSISGYHIAEAGANPLTQLALTLANGFTLLEIYKARGMDVDAFAKNFSFFFSNGVDAEYSVIGRVARKIWAVALKKLYGANERSQKLKYHIQTSGRSLHAQEMQYNDIRTTLQALYAISDNCNSLHTNAFDEAITTPTEKSVRQAVAIQMIINHELGLTKNENFWQGSYFILELSKKVQEQVLQIFDELNHRGGVLGAMETCFQRSKIQEESLFYEHKKASGELKIIGVNSFLQEGNASENTEQNHELRRSSQAEKDAQVEQVEFLQKAFVKERKQALLELKKTVQQKNNCFENLMEAAKYCSLGELSQAFFEVGGHYRRSM